MTSQAQLNVIPHFFHVNLPEKLTTQIEQANTSEEVKDIGFKWTLHQSEELMNANVPALHYYTMGKAQVVERVISELF